MSKILTDNEKTEIALYYDLTTISGYFKIHKATARMALNNKLNDFDEFDVCNYLRQNSPTIQITRDIVSVLYQNENSKTI